MTHCKLSTKNHTWARLISNSVLGRDNEVTTSPNLGMARNTYRTEDLQSARRVNTCRTEGLQSARRVTHVELKV
jgi:hypothetical protein